MAAANEFRWVFNQSWLADGASFADRSDESQASQLLAAALRPRDVCVTPSAPSNDEHHSGLPEDSLQSSGNSVHYHMHGLVATQSQSLCSGEDQVYLLEGSQKENTPASWDKSDASLPHVPSLVPSPARAQPTSSYTAELKETTSNVSLSKESNEKSRPKELGGRINGHSSPVKGAKGVSLASPSHSLPKAYIDRSSTVPTRPMPPPPIPRSPSLPSQDSFAGPLPQPDPAKAFIAQAKNFAIPLSQLGEDSQSDEEGPPPIASGMWSSHNRKAVSRPSSPPGKILVVGTPSNSTHDSQSQQPSISSRDSQSQQQRSHQTDSQDGQGDTSGSIPQAQPRTVDLSDYVDQPTQEESYSTQPTQEDEHRPSSPGASTEPTSSYQRLLGSSPYAAYPGDDTPPTQIVNDSTQLADETPPTQIDSADISTIAREHEYYNDRGQVEFPSVPSDARSSNMSRLTDRRGLRGLIAPEKWYRYENIKPDPGRPFAFTAAHTERTQDTQPSGVRSSPDPVDETQVEATQPSDVAVNGSALSTFPRRRGLPPANVALQARGLKPYVPPAPKSPDTRVVSDSEGAEPTQIAEPLSPPVRRGQPSPSPATPPLSPMKARQRHLQSEDEVLRTIAATEPSVSAVQEEKTEEEEERDIRPAAREEEEEEQPQVPAVREEEEEDDDDVPLAAVRYTKMKGKKKAAEAPSDRTASSSPLATRARASKAPQSPSKKGVNRDLAIKRSRSWKDVVIPSSDPQERREDANAAAVKKKRSAKPRTPIAQPTRAPTAPRAAKLAARGKLHESSTEDEDEEDEEYEEYEDDIPEEDADDHDTVPADDDEMDVDLPNPPPPTRNNKRKRAVSSSSRKVPSKPVVKEEAATPLTRPTKRAKTASAVRGGGGHVATRVFALWKHLGHYYSGIVQEIVGSKCKVKFDDEETATLELKQIRCCQLQRGDHVLLVDGTKPVEVIDVPSCASTGHQADDMVTIRCDDEEDTVPVHTIRVASRTVAAAWNDRVLTENDIVPLVRPKVSRPSPTPSRFSVPSEGSGRGGAKRVLAKTGLVVTLSPKNQGWSQQRDNLMAQIKRSGGVVLDDWTNLYTMEGSFSQKGQRWILTPDDIQWRKNKEIDRVFLISDDHHQKPKFLIALALGVPCLSVDWLQAIVDEVRTRPFLSGGGSDVDVQCSRRIRTGDLTCFRLVTRSSLVPVCPS